MKITQITVNGHDFEIFVNEQLPPTGWMLVSTRSSDMERRECIPCEHPGCFSHVSHPCEGCGRKGGRMIEVEGQLFTEAEVAVVKAKWGKQPTKNCGICNGTGLHTSTNGRGEGPTVYFLLRCACTYVSKEREKA